MKNELIKRFVDIYKKNPDVLAQAGGRIEFIGNHTDYNGGFVMGLALDHVIIVALSKRSDKKACFASHKTGETHIVDLENIKKNQLNWINYPLGVFNFLVEAGLKFDCGFDMLDMSDLPSGAGLSSSAAIEMASAFAFSKLYNFDCDLKTKVRIARKAENKFVGMPCGILDQGVSGFGKKDSVVFIDCLTEEFSNYPLDKNAKFWMFNSMKKHALVDGEYAKLNAECMSAAKILSGDGEFKLLRHFSIQDLDNAKSKMSQKTYNIAKHVIEENDRVLKAKESLLAGDMIEVGKLLFASHNSSRHLFGNSIPELDFIVDELAKQKNVYGARLCGGGFGGAVMAFTNQNFSESQAQEVAKIYKEKFGIDPKIFTCLAGEGAKVL